MPRVKSYVLDLREGYGENSKRRRVKASFAVSHRWLWGVGTAPHANSASLPSAKTGPWRRPRVAISGVCCLLLFLALNSLRRLLSWPLGPPDFVLPALCYEFYVATYADHATPSRLSCKKVSEGEPAHSLRTLWFTTGALYHLSPMSLEICWIKLLNMYFIVQ